MKSMQMLQANAKFDQSQPFEDYSIFLYRQTAPNFEDRVKDLEKKFTYVPDHDKSATRTGAAAPTGDEEIAARIKSLEDKWRDPQPVEKKPKDLMRAIGKIDNSDWNIKEIEKKIRENKMGKSVNKDREKVPKWSKEQFLARQTKMEKKHLDRQDSIDAKYADIDKNIRHLELKLKEGTSRDLGQNKVATITEKLASKTPVTEQKVEKSASKPVINFAAPSSSDLCHFCGKRVYLMERLSAEGRFFHHGCFKCQYCHTQLRLGSYAFDRDGFYDNKFFCVHHYGMQGELKSNKPVKKSSQRAEKEKSPEKKTPGISNVDLLNKVQAVDAKESANISSGHVSSDPEDSLSQMDEDEWTDKNFGASCAEEVDDDSEDESSSLSDTDSDDEDAFDDALEVPVTKEGTLKLAERLSKRYSRKHNDSQSDDYSSSDQSSYYENSSDDDESDTATEGEEEIRARELRKQEVRVEPPVVQTDTGTDTEVKQFNLSSQMPDILNSNNNNSNLNATSELINRSSDNLSVKSGEYNSAESGDVDFTFNKLYKSNECLNKEQDSVISAKLTLTPSNSKDNKMKANPLAKSSTVGNIVPKKPLRNFVIPSRESRKSFGAEFVPKFKPPEPEPLLIIKRTPSKITLPKEVGKPKVAVNTAVLNAKKYFGDTNKPKIPKPTPLKRCETISTVPKSPLIKQISLPETSDEKKEKEVKSFNFEPEDDDLKDLDNYIENLLANEDELQKPIDPKKYHQPSSESDEEKEEKLLDSSIEDLLKALETETSVDPVVEVKADDKIEDLLNWMEDLDHQTYDKKVYRSFSDVKYKNLERVLKAPKRGDSIISKIPKNNLSFFEQHLSGKGVPQDVDSDEDDTKGRHFLGLKRSKTEIACSKPRTSVDLDAVSNVDIRKMLQKFESNIDEKSGEDKKVIPKSALSKRKSFGAFGRQSMDLGNKNAKSIKASEKSMEETLKDLEKFVETTLESIGNKYENVPKVDEKKKDKEDKWCVNITVSSIPNMEFLKAQEKENNNNNDELLGNLNEKVAEEASGPILKADNSSSVDKVPNSNIPIESTSSDQTRDNENEYLKVYDEDSISAIMNFAKAVESSDESEASPRLASTSCSSSEDNEHFRKLQEKAHDFQKAVESSTSDMDSAKQNFKSESTSTSVPNNDNLIAHDFSKAIYSSDDSSAASAAQQNKCDIESLYSTVNKPKKENLPPHSPIVPKRTRKISDNNVPPQRPVRQKSLEKKQEHDLPVVPQRRKATSVSPLPQRRSLTDQSKLPVKKETVKTFNTQTPQKVAMRQTLPPNADLSQYEAHFKEKNKDKDCCIQ